MPIDPTPRLGRGFILAGQAGSTGTITPRRTTTRGDGQSARTPALILIGFVLEGPPRVGSSYAQTLGKDY